ncbi:MAG: right-handed parallel beta-helix repeat-containing protein [archaeon]|nr:right-handed parallel beta-helix repeat-containing protein [archaeon]
MVKKKYVLLCVTIALIALSVFSVQLLNNPYCFATYSGQSTLVSGYLSQNTIWTLAGSPYIVIGDVVIDAGVSLTIEPGVVVKFTDGTNLVVDGSLIAHGNSANKITFTSDTTMPKVGDWGAIKIRNHGEISYSIVEYAYVGVIFDMATGSLAKSLIRFNSLGVFISHSNVQIDDVNVTENSEGIYHYCTPEFETMIKDSYIGRSFWVEEIWLPGGMAGVGIYNSGYGRRLTIENCTISDNDRDGICGGGYISVYDSRISSNKWFGIGEGSYAYIHSSIISNNSLTGVRCWKIEIYNSFITNNGFGGDPAFYAGVEGFDVTISNCSITHNVGDGLRGTYSNLSVTHNEISKNGGNGILVIGASEKGGNNLIQYNDIQQNGNSGICLNKPLAQYPGSALIQYNNIYQNAYYDIKNDNPLDINAANNWWGTTNETLIKEHIYDYYDNYYRGKVLYKPCLSTPVEIGIPPSGPELAPYIVLALAISIVAVVAIVFVKQRKKKELKGKENDINKLGVKD